MARRLDYKDPRRELDQNRYVYAVVSRRAQGLSIGVNLNPDKACNFDCPYCQVDRTTPGGPSRVGVDDLAAELEDLLQRARRDLWSHPPFDTVAPELRRVADVALAGDWQIANYDAMVAAQKSAILRGEDLSRQADQLLGKYNEIEEMKKPLQLKIYDLSLKAGQN